MESFSVI